MATVTSPSDPARSERRRAVRAVVECPAQLELASGARTVALIDLSESGARVRLETAPSLGASVRLAWHVHEAFGTVVWISRDLCGIKFDRLLSRHIVERTVSYEEVEVGPVAAVRNIPVGRKRSFPDLHGVQSSRADLAQPEPERARRRYFRRTK